MKKVLHNNIRYLLSFFTLIAAGLILGAAGGVVGGAFSIALGKLTAFRMAHSIIIWLLPAGGLVIAFLYHFEKTKPTDTNGILIACRETPDIPFFTLPVIFVSSAITHLFGGSAGREGAALQMGGELGAILAKLVKTEEKVSRILVMCGMSAVFSALFGTPLAAAVFSMEVVSVGAMQYAALIPCLTSSLLAAQIAAWMGAAGESFPLTAALPFSIGNISGMAFIAAVCSLMSILYCVSLKFCHHKFEKLVPNHYLCIALGGLAIAVLTALLGTTAYNGAGMNSIEEAIMEGIAEPEAFFIKFVFTVITMSAGYKGGEIVPAMFIGSTLGCTIANLLGLNAGMGAAIGLIAMFCGSLNCPISSMLLALEMFGSTNLRFFAIACAISYVLSADFSLYKEQKFMFSKLHAGNEERFAS